MIDMLVVDDVAENKAYQQPSEAFDIEATLKECLELPPSDPRWRVAIDKLGYVLNVYGAALDEAASRSAEALPRGQEKTSVTPPSAASTAPADDDRELIAICGKIQALSREAKGLDTHSEAFKHNDKQWQSLMREAAAIPAKTLAGLQARVRALDTCIDEHLRMLVAGADWWTDGDQPMREALLRDLTGSNASQYYVSSYSLVMEPHRPPARNR